MNTSSQKASAKILSNVIKKTILKGEQYCRIYQPKINWNNSIIDPCIKFLKNNGCEIDLRKSLKSIKIDNNHISKLCFSENTIQINEQDSVIFAIPPTNFS